MVTNDDQSDPMIYIYPSTTHDRHPQQVHRHTNISISNTNKPLEVSANSPVCISITPTQSLAPNSMSTGFILIIYVKPLDLNACHAQPQSKAKLKASIPSSTSLRGNTTVYTDTQNTNVAAMCCQQCSRMFQGHHKLIRCLPCMRTTRSTSLLVPNKLISPAVLA